MCKLRKHKLRQIGITHGGWGPKRLVGGMPPCPRWLRSCAVRCNRTRWKQWVTLNGSCKASFTADTARHARMELMRRRRTWCESSDRCMAPDAMPYGAVRRGIRCEGAFRRYWVTSASDADGEDWDDDVSECLRQQQLVHAATTNASTASLHLQRLADVTFATCHVV